MALSSVEIKNQLVGTPHTKYCGSQGATVTAHILEHSVPTVKQWGQSVPHSGGRALGCRDAYLQQEQVNISGLKGRGTDLNTRKNQKQSSCRLQRLESNVEIILPHE